MIPFAFAGVLAERGQDHVLQVASVTSRNAVGASCAGAVTFESVLPHVSV